MLTDYGKEMLTDYGRRAIITAGRDDAFRRLLPSVKGLAAYQLALDGGLLFLLLVVHVATELDRFQNKRGNHYDHRDNLEVRHDLTSFNFRIQR